MSMSYLIVGSGYRAEYFGRIAGAYPELFRAMYLCRSQEKAERMTRHTGMPATIREDEARAFHPDFVIVAVDRPSIAAVTMEWAEKGYPVACETPMGASREELCRLWELHTAKGARIISLEQYPRYPILMAGMQAVRQGLIGPVNYAHLSLAHDYHAAALLREFLGTRGERYTMHGERIKVPVEATDSRYSAVHSGETVMQDRDVVHITYESGKRALYDFSSVQYRTFIRSRHLILTGERGEWSDTTVYYTDSEHEPQRMQLLPEIPKRYRTLDNQALRDLRKTWHSELFLDTIQDEFAIASLLMDMGEYIRGGEEPYALRDALDDACFCLDIQEAVAAPWTPVASKKMPWHS